MIRLLSIQPVAERGGSDQALLRMVRSLPPDEFECHVVVPAEPPLRAELEAAGVTVHVVADATHLDESPAPATGPRTRSAGRSPSLRLRRLIHRLDIDVVHTNSLHSWYGWAAAALARRPHVWHAREIVVQSGAALRVERFLTRHCATRVDRDVASDRRPARRARRRRRPRDRRRRRRSTPGEPAGSAPRPESPTTRPSSGTIGRIDTWKGVDVLLDAWPAPRRRSRRRTSSSPGAAVEGKESYAQDLDRRAAALADVHWLGELDDDVPDLLADLDVFVRRRPSPSRTGSCSSRRS